eukprot:Blabericola_migrator_1__7810@NODE_399_length_8954_cov_45_082480_g313_i1_p2_GENE_NODE_399_length_8954_cov_45_082480_g313_i1NODE_399_length_8954_cov_45_082480_g313_i1_p2_ORF_typecomplete_len795_score104_99_NODE_399_length_8954_cov_45_082480_g313_i162308614
MKSVILTPKAPRQWLPCCVVLIQPQDIRGIPEDPAWKGLLNTSDSIDSEPANPQDFLTEGYPTVAEFLEGFSWDNASHIFNVDDSSRDNFDWVTELPDSAEGTKQSCIPELATTQLSYDEQAHLDSCNVEKSALAQWLDPAKQLLLKLQSTPTDPLNHPGSVTDEEHFAYNNFDWVEELPHLDEQFQSKISEVNTEVPALLEYVKSSVTDSSCDSGASSFPQGIALAPQLPSMETLRINTPAAVPPSQDLFVSQYPSCTQGEVASADASTLIIVDLRSVAQSHIAHVYTSPTRLWQPSQTSTLDQEQPHHQEGPLNTRDTAAIPLARLTSFRSVGGPLISQHLSLAEDQQPMDTSLAPPKLFSFLDCPANPLPRAAYKVQPHLFDSKQRDLFSATTAHRVDSTQQGGIHPNSSPIEILEPAHPPCAAIFARPRKRSVEGSAGGPQEAKRSRPNSEFFEFKTKLLNFVETTPGQPIRSEELVEELMSQDNSSLAIMLRCFGIFTKPDIDQLWAPDFFAAHPGQTSWMFHWLCYAFDPSDQSCILDVELKKHQPVPRVKPDHVSDRAWAMITDTTRPRQVQAFCNAVYQIHEAWKVKRRRPPHGEETMLDEVLETQLRLCEQPCLIQRCGIVNVCDPHEHLFASQRFENVANHVFHQKPIFEEGVRPDDEFYQMMKGVAAAAGIGVFSSGKRAENVLRFWKQLAFQLLDLRYRGPHGESIMNGLIVDPKAIRQCIKRGFLKPELLQSVISEVNIAECAKMRSKQRFIMSVLTTSASLFLKWAESWVFTQGQTNHTL